MAVSRARPNKRKMLKGMRGKYKKNPKGNFTKLKKRRNIKKSTILVNVPKRRAKKRGRKRKMNTNPLYAKSISRMLKNTNKPVKIYNKKKLKSKSRQEHRIRRARKVNAVNSRPRSGFERRLKKPWRGLHSPASPKT